MSSPLTRDGPLWLALQRGVEQYKAQRSMFRSGSAGEFRATAVQTLLELDQVRNSPNTLVPAIALALLTATGWGRRRTQLANLVAERVVHEGALGAAMGERMSKLRPAYEHNYQERCVVACIIELTSILPADLLNGNAFSQMLAAFKSPDEHTRGLVIDKLTEMAAFNVLPMRRA